VSQPERGLWRGLWALAGNPEHFFLFFFLLGVFFPPQKQQSKDLVN
jgi:hypothetical protein